MEVKRKLPENFEQSHLRYFEPNLVINLTEPGCKWFSKNILLLPNGILINGLKVEKQSLLYNTRLADIGGSITLIKMIIKLILKNKPAVIHDEVDYVTIVNEWTNNYFHWFTEAIPKLICLMEKDKKPLVLLPANYQSDYQTRSLDIMGFSYKFFSGNLVICKNIFLPSRLAPSSAQYNPQAMKQIAMKLKEAVTLDIKKGRRIYVSRQKATIRKIVNEVDVVKLVKEFDFEVINFEDYNLDEQISIMHHSEILVSIHGAGLTNMIFCKPNTSVLEISLKNQTMDKCYFNLANAMDLQYYYQFCESNNNSNDYHNSNLLVDMIQLRKNLELITKKYYD